jgi:hypothetical protein
MRSTLTELALLCISASSGIAMAQDGYVPPHGFVPDAATAITIARAVLIPIYGAKTIKSEEPLIARRKGDTWDVVGTLPCPAEGRCDGGTAELKLLAADGQILFVTHYK